MNLKRSTPILAILLAAASLAPAQQLTITGPTNSVRAGSAVTLNVVLSGSAGLNLAGVELNIANPGAALTCSAGLMATLAAKIVVCQTTGTTLTLLLYGINATTLTDGVIAQLNLTAPATGGTLTEALTNLVGANLAGSGVSMTAGSPFGLSIASPCDLNLDGVTDSKDVLAMVSTILTGSGTGVDLTSDGKIDMLDLQRIVNAAVAGGTCKTGQSMEDLEPHVYASIRYLLHHSQIPLSAWEDATQEALLAVTAAKAKFQRIHNCSWKTYAERKAGWAIQDYLRRTDPLTRAQRRKIKEGVNPAPRFLPVREHHRVAAPVDVTARVDVSRFLTVLKPRALAVIRRLYWQGETITEIAHSDGVTVAAIWLTRRGALHKMRADFGVTA